MPDETATDAAAQLSELRGAMQSGQPCSLESLWGAVIVFTGQGNGGGYAASAGPVIVDAQLIAAGLLEQQCDRAFRVLEMSLIADGVVIHEGQSTLLEAGRLYRIAKVIRPPNDPAIRLVCKIA